MDKDKIEKLRVLLGEKQWVYLGASKGKEKFYEKFGFVARKDADLGEGMIFSKNS